MFQDGKMRRSDFEHIFMKFFEGEIFALLFFHCIPQVHETEIAYIIFEIISRSLNNHVIERICGSGALKTYF